VRVPSGRVEPEPGCDVYWPNRLADTGLVHSDQFEVDDGLARELLFEQFPQWSDLPIRRIATAATVNAIFRLGADLVVRFPLQGAEDEELHSEARAITKFTQLSIFPVSVPVAIGRASERYPSAWSVQTWLPGVVATADGHAESRVLATDVAALITALRKGDVAGSSFDGQGRGGDLRDHDDWMTRCFEKSADLVNTDHASHLWQTLRELPNDGQDVMSHKDLTPPNLLVRRGRLAGVLDCGAFGPADPAVDLVAAWHLFDPPARAIVRFAVGPSDVEWRRGAAWALQQAMGLIWYYQYSNPDMSQLGRTTLKRLLTDPELTSGRMSK
jgi:aminoglycoside phosphotransferase (APT) family kinase protein